MGAETNMHHICVHNLRVYIYMKRENHLVWSRPNLPLNLCRLLTAASTRQLRYSCFYFTRSQWDLHLSRFLRSTLADWQSRGKKNKQKNRTVSFLVLFAQKDLEEFNTYDESIISNQSTLFIFTSVFFPPYTRIRWLMNICDTERCHRRGDMLLLCSDRSPQWHETYSVSLHQSRRH